MTSQHYSESIIVSASPEAAYQALTEGFEHWWTKPEGVISANGDRSKFCFSPGDSYWTFEAKQLIPSSLVQLECVDAHHAHEGLPASIEKEWLGTTAQWLIREDKDSGQTRIDFEHHGLSPELGCFDVCRAGWNFFFLESLKAYLDKGLGMPHD